MKKMFDNEMKYVECIYEVVSYNFNVAVGYYTGEKANEITSKIVLSLGKKGMKSLIKDMEKLFKSYDNSYEYEEGLKCIWDEHIEENF